MKITEQIKSRVDAEMYSKWSIICTFSPKIKRDWYVGAIIHELAKERDDLAYNGHVTEEFIDWVFNVACEDPELAEFIDTVGERIVNFEEKLAKEN
jgi:hypothetical protein